MEDPLQRFKEIAKNNLNITQENFEIEFHKYFHIILKTSSFDTSNLTAQLNSGAIKPCKEDKQENCFSSAQDNENAEVLKILLKHDASAVNTIRGDNNSLLFHEIICFRSRNAEFLIDLGADVNLPDITLHAALRNRFTPLNVIKKLIEHNADINILCRNKCLPSNLYEEMLDEELLNENDNESFLQNKFVVETPLLSVLRNFKHSKICTLLEKVKVLVEMGANVKTTNSRNETPLMLATKLPINNPKSLEVIKYLIDHGARIRNPGYKGRTCLSTLIYQSRQLSELSNSDKIAAIKNHFIPAINLLYISGDSIFHATVENDDYSIGRDSLSNITEDYSPLRFAIEYGHHELAIYLAKIGIGEIKIHGHNIIKKANKIKETCPEYHQYHPIYTIMQMLPSLIQKSGDRNNVAQKMLSEIIKLFRENSTFINEYFTAVNEFEDVRSLPQHYYLYERTKLTLYSIVLVDHFIYLTDNRHHGLRLDHVLEWFTKLKEANIKLCYEDQRKLLRNFVSYFPNETNVGLLKRFLEILGNSVNITTSTIKFNLPPQKNKLKNELNRIQNYLQIPDCVFLAAYYGNVTYLKHLLPYYNQHPLTVLLLLRPWHSRYFLTDQKAMLGSIVKIVSLLIEVGGPIPHGTHIFNLMQRYIKQWRQANVYEYYDPEPIISRLKTDSESPASLQILCRTCIRANAVGYGNNLPEHLSIFKNKSALIRFLTLTENYDEAEPAWAREFREKYNLPTNFTMDY